jgi:adenosine 3'-phospho 5'-phosphosulfate transporter B2
VTGEPIGRAARTTPLYKFSFSSVSNILSSVCQYEALKFLSFPTQVLAKSCKMVPVMLMGYVVNRKTYSGVEYLVAISVTAGAAIFKLYEENDAPVMNTEFVGIVLIVGYMASDSFTSNWQSSVFKSYSVSSMAMMLYANLFSSAFTALGLLVTLEIVEVLDYFERNPSILPHMFLMAICSAIGQLFIFHTIKRFGPLVFATIQTVRQFLSVVLSIVFFAHPLNAMEAVGIAIVFVALGGQIVQKWLSKRGPHAKRPLPPTPPNDEIAAAPPDVDNPKASLLRTTERTGSRSLD